ncbi:MAG TPA: mannose-6-phosphate isomerase, partial [Ruminococcaceae bacterium]|nr:mannose-6-phosphate isomerase [Oscillospiraceae bacterium]
DYIWGGNRLREEYGKISDADKIAESWELSCHKDGQSVIANGKDKGKTLSEYVAENKKSLGTACDRFEYFPILIKLIDAKDNLSVQVHPDNDYAMRVEGEYGKTEMWYIV